MSWQRCKPHCLSQCELAMSMVSHLLYASGHRYAEAVLQLVCAQSFWVRNHLASHSNHLGTDWWSWCGIHFPFIFSKNKILNFHEVQIFPVVLIFLFLIFFKPMCKSLHSVPWSLLLRKQTRDRHPSSVPNEQLSEFYDYNPLFAGIVTLLQVFRRALLLCSLSSAIYKLHPSSTI